MLHRFPKGLAGDKVHQKRLPAGAPPWVETVRAALPALEPHRRRALRHRARRGDLGGADVDRRVPPVEQPARGHREARRVAHRPRPRAADATTTGPPGRPRRPRGPRRARRRRLPQDQRQQGHARLRADPARARLQGRTPRGARLRPRGRAPGPRRRHDDLVDARTATRTTCSSTTTRTPATTPSRRRTPSAACPTPGSRRRSGGTRSTTSTRATSRSSRCPQRFAELGDLHADIDDHVFDIAPLLEWADRDERGGAEAPAEPGLTAAGRLQ